MNKPVLPDPKVLCTFRWPQSVCTAQLGFLKGNISSGLVSSGDLGWYPQRGPDDSAVREWDPISPPWQVLGSILQIPDGWATVVNMVAASTAVRGIFDQGLAVCQVLS